MSAKSNYQERRAARLDDPALEGVRNPRAQRLIAAGLVAVFLLEIVVLFTARLMPLAVFIGVMLVILFAGVILLGALKASTRGVEELSPEVLDERQAQLRAEIFAKSYWALAVAAIVACLLVALMGQSWWPLDDPMIMLVPALLVQVIVAIPTFVTALRVRV